MPAAVAMCWDTILLADGNIGIGGDPVALLVRCRQLAALRGRVVLELSVPPARSGAHLLRLEHEERRSAWFAWASLSADDLEGVAGRGGLAVAATSRCADTGRQFAVLVPTAVVA